MNIGLKKIRSLSNFFEKPECGFEENIKKINCDDFTIISNNCLGGRVYQILKIPYQTPTIGLFFFAPDYITFIYNLREYIRVNLEFKTKSKYNFLNINCSGTRLNYPIGSLTFDQQEVDIHFLHYATEEECCVKWNERKKRINWDKLYFILTDSNFFYQKIFQLFEKFPSKNKVCFTAHRFGSKIAVQLKEYEGQCSVGNLYADYEILTKYFDFAKWINN